MPHTRALVRSFVLCPARRSRRTEGTEDGEGRGGEGGSLFPLLLSFPPLERFGYCVQQTALHPLSLRTRRFNGGGIAHYKKDKLTS